MILKYWKEETLKSLREAKKYEEGWDSYDAKKPLQESIDMGIDIVERFSAFVNEKDIDSFPDFCLAPDGIVGFEWCNKDVSYFVRFVNLENVNIVTSDNKKNSLDMTFRYFQNYLISHMVS